jgi:TetR/AcrR family transcriptional repressor of nem operon
MLIWRHGYNAVSVDAICEAAGALKGSFYHAFASKADLLTEAINLIWARDAEQLNAFEKLDLTAAERLERHLDWFIGSQRRHLAEHGFVAGHFHSTIDTSVPEAAQAATANRAAYRAMLRVILADALIERGADTDHVDRLTDTITYMIGGVTSEARLSNSLAPIEAMKPLALHMVEQAIVASPSKVRRARRA